MKIYTLLHGLNIDSLENETFFLINSRMNELHVEKIYLNLGQESWGTVRGRVQRVGLTEIQFNLSNFFLCSSHSWILCKQWQSDEFFFAFLREQWRVSTQTGFNLVYRKIKLVHCSVVGSFWEDSICAKSISMLFGFIDTLFEYLLLQKILKF